MKYTQLCFPQEKQVKQTITKIFKSDRLDKLETGSNHNAAKVNAYNFVTKAKNLSSLVARMNNIS